MIEPGDLVRIRQITSVDVRYSNSGHFAIVERVAGAAVWVRHITGPVSKLPKDELHRACTGFYERELDVIIKRFTLFTPELIDAALG